jgi:anti-anti-sigma factor
MSLTIDVINADAGVYKVRLAGNLDSETVPLFERHMEQVWADPAVRVVSLELHDLSFISSMGLGVVAKVKKALAERGGTMITIGAQPQIIRVFQIVNMLPRETVFASRQEADDYLTAIQQKIIEQQQSSNAATGSIS